MGKPIRDARRVDIPLAAECIAYYGEAVTRCMTTSPPPPKSSSDDPTRAARSCRGSRPLELPAADGFAGSSVRRSLQATRDPEARRTIAAHRAPSCRAGCGGRASRAGVLQVVPGFGETAGQALGRHMDVDMVAFTGSTEVGKFFLRYSGESNMKHFSLECGGKSPNIVFSDATTWTQPRLPLAWPVSSTTRAKYVMRHRA